MSLTLDKYRDKVRLRFPTHKECRKFINQMPLDGLMSKNSIREKLPMRWTLPKQTEEFWGVKFGKVLKIKGLAVYFDGYKKITQREYSLEKLLG